MSTRGSAIFLQVPDPSGRRVLRPGKGVSGHARIRAARFEEADMPVEANQEAIVYYELDGRFMRQAARIHTVSESQGGTVVSFRVTGQPELAETRQCYRVSTVTLDITATLERENHCPVLDVSATGIAAGATGSYGVDQIIDVCVRYETSSYFGRMHVATADGLARGQRRYGLLCVDDQKANGNLIGGLTYINLAVQRLHLRRLARVS